MSGMHYDLRDLVTRRLAELGLGDRPLSYRAAEERARSAGKRLNKETLRKLALGQHSGLISDETVDGLATALAVPRAEVLRHMHATQSESLGRWDPPDSAHRLTFAQRRAVEQVIRTMVNPAARLADDGVDLVPAGDQGLFVAQSTDSPALSDDDREANERIADEKLDQMERDARTRRRFGGS